MEPIQKASSADHPDREVKSFFKDSSDQIRKIPDDLEAQHAKGEYPISIGTSLAIEKLINPELHKANTPAVTDAMKVFDVLFISINTLIRNALSSMPSEIQHGISPKPVTEWVLRDMQLIQTIFDQEKVPVVFYTLTYKGLLKAYPFGTQRVPKTVKQMSTKDLYDEVSNSVTEQIVADHKHGLKDITLMTGDMSVVVEYQRPLFMTSTPIDVIEMGKGGKYGLIQSYTAKIVDAFDMFHFFQVNSKHKERSYHRIPFNRLFIQIFGDGKTFHQSGVALLNQILDCADKHEWTQKSTHERIKLTMGIEELWDKSYDKVKF